MDALGIHILIECYGCSAERLDDLPFLRKMLRITAQENAMTVVNEVSHKFQPIGASAVLLLAESHLSIHTWPEHGYAAIDFFSCDTRTQPEKVLASLERFLHPQKHQLKVIMRGSEVLQGVRP